MFKFLIVCIFVFAVIFVVARIPMVKALFAPAKPPAKEPPPAAKSETKTDQGSQIEAEHIAVIHAVLMHYLGTAPKTIRITSIKPL